MSGGIEIARHWRLKQQRYTLNRSICPACNTPDISARFNHGGACLSCGSSQVKDNETGQTVLVLLGRSGLKTKKEYRLT